MQRRLVIGNHHVDTKWKVEFQSVHGHKYFLKIVEEFIRYTQAYYLREKLEAPQLLLSFVVKF